MSRSVCSTKSYYLHIMPHRAEALSDDARLTSVWRLSVYRVYIGPKSRTERPRKTNIGIEVAHVTRDSDTLSRSKVQRSTCRGRGHIVAASRTACLIFLLDVLLTQKLLLIIGLTSGKIFIFQQYSAPSAQCQIIQSSCYIKRHVASSRGISDRPTVVILILTKSADS